MTTKAYEMNYTQINCQNKERVQSRQAVPFKIPLTVLSFNWLLATGPLVQVKGDTSQQFV